MNKNISSHGKKIFIFMNKNISFHEKKSHTDDNHLKDRFF